MNRMRTRFVVLHLTVLALLIVLGVRLYQVQVVRGQLYVAKATETRTRAVMVPALRGQILDSTGRPLVRNLTRLVVSVDRTRLERMPRGGQEVLEKLSAVLAIPVAKLRGAPAVVRAGREPPVLDGLASPADPGRRPGHPARGADHPGAPGRVPRRDGRGAGAA